MKKAILRYKQHLIQCGMVNRFSIPPEDAQKALEHSPIVVPTETVWGLAAHATEHGVQTLHTLKRRLPNKPFCVVVPSLQKACEIIDIPSPVMPFLQQLWPGPLTFIGTSKQPHLSAILGTPTIGVRFCDHPSLQQVFRQCADPLILTSANISGSLSITHQTQLDPELHHLPILESSSHYYGIESTVVRWHHQGWEVLRLGATTLEKLAEFAPVTYRYIPPAQQWCRITAKPPEKCPFIGFGFQYPDEHNLSKEGCLLQACRRVYAILHAVKHEPMIAAAPLPPHGLGKSLQDTLMGIMAPRDGLEPPTK